MDSMRHLTTSLPRTSRRRNEPDILSSFKAAALSVTNLYRAAAADSTHAREAGYQDALDDLLAFLDKDHIGMDDGEGWRVRKWILERLEDAPSLKTNISEDEEEKTEEADTRCSSPEAQKRGTTQQLVSELNDATERGTASEAPQQPVSATLGVPSIGEFSFRTLAQLPSNNDKENNQGMDMDATPTAHRITSRSNRPRHNGPSRRDGRGSTPSINLTLASGTNGKRKFPYGDFFDIGNLSLDSSDKKDGGRGGKRSRHV